MGLNTHERQKTPTIKAGVASASAFALCGAIALNINNVCAAQSDAEDVGAKAVVSPVSEGDLTESLNAEVVKEEIKNLLQDTTRNNKDLLIKMQNKEYEALVREVIIELLNSGGGILINAWDDCKEVQQLTSWLINCNNTTQRVKLRPGDMLSLDKSDLSLVVTRGENKFVYKALQWRSIFWSEFRASTGVLVQEVSNWNGAGINSKQEASKLPPTSKPEKTSAVTAQKEGSEPISWADIYRLMIWNGYQVRQWDNPENIIWKLEEGRVLQCNRPDNWNSNYKCIWGDVWKVWKVDNLGQISIDGNDTWNFLNSPRSRANETTKLDEPRVSSAPKVADESFYSSLMSEIKSLIGNLKSYASGNLTFSVVILLTSLVVALYGLVRIAKWIFTFGSWKKAKSEKHQESRRDVSDSEEVNEPIFDEREIRMTERVPEKRKLVSRIFGSTSKWDEKKEEGQGSGWSEPFLDDLVRKSNRVSEKRNFFASYIPKKMDLGLLVPLVFGIASWAECKSNDQVYVRGGNSKWEQMKLSWYDCVSDECVFKDAKWREKRVVHSSVKKEVSLKKPNDGGLDQQQKDALRAQMSRLMDKEPTERSDNDYRVSVPTYSMTFSNWVSQETDEDIWDDLMIESVVAPSDDDSKWGDEKPITEKEVDKDAEANQASNQVVSVTGSKEESKVSHPELVLGADALDDALRNSNEDQLTNFFKWRLNKRPIIIQKHPNWFKLISNDEIADMYWETVLALSNEYLKDLKDWETVRICLNNMYNSEDAIGSFVYTHLYDLDPNLENQCLITFPVMMQDGKWELRGKYYYLFQKWDQLFNYWIKKLWDVADQNYFNCEDLKWNKLEENWYFRCAFFDNYALEIIELTEEMSHGRFNEDLSKSPISWYDQYGLLKHISSVQEVASELEIQFNSIIVEHNNDNPNVDEIIHKLSNIEFWEIIDVENRDDEMQWLYYSLFRPRFEESTGVIESVNIDDSINNLDGVLDYGWDQYWVVRIWKALSDKWSRGFIVRVNKEERAIEIVFPANRSPIWKKSV